MVSSLIGSSVGPLESRPQASGAAALGPLDRSQLAVAALAGHPVTSLAEEHDVSRKFVYQQAEVAREALDKAFSLNVKSEEKVLFTLPVTKAWIKQLVLGLTLICHSPSRGVIEFLRDLFDIAVSEGTVLNILLAAVLSAREVNSREDLSGVRIGAHDEIFQNRRPVLVGADVYSTYCYLLVLEDHRDADTWGVHLLDLEVQGLHPETTIADGGLGVRAGQALAWPAVPCRADVFHAEMDIGQAVTYLQNRAIGAIWVLTTLTSCGSSSIIGGS